MSYVTETGLVVTDRRHTRSDDPRSWPDNGNVQPPPPVGAGPTTSEGYGNDHVMYPAATTAVTTTEVGQPRVMPWSGWAVEWDTPTWGGGLPGGPTEAAGKVSTMFAALDRNSSILSTMPPYLVEGGRVITSPAWMTNPQPEVYTGWIEAMEQLVWSYFQGEAFLWATSRNDDGPFDTPGSVRSWVVLNPAWVDVEMRGQLRRFKMGGLDITDDVLHVRYKSWPGVPRGIGAPAALAYALFGAQALERYQSSLAMRGGVPWGALTFPGNMTAEQASAARDAFVAARMSALGAPAVLSGGVQLTPFNINPRDMALLELRQFDEARIATLMCCPPTLLALPSGEGSLTYNNATAIYDYHWRAMLRPPAAKLMEAISNWALPPTQRAELNRDEYTRPGFTERVPAYSTLWNMHDEQTGQRGITLEQMWAAERMNGDAPMMTAVAS
jgi:hypothetical protein